MIVVTVFNYYFLLITLLHCGGKNMRPIKNAIIQEYIDNVKREFPMYSDYHSEEYIEGLFNSGGDIVKKVRSIIYPKLFIKYKEARYNSQWNKPYFDYKQKHGSPSLEVEKALLSSFSLPYKWARIKAKKVLIKLKDAVNRKALLSDVDAQYLLLFLISEDEKLERESKHLLEKVDIFSNKKWLLKQSFYDIREGIRSLFGVNFSNTDVGRCLTILKQEGLAANTAFMLSSEFYIVINYNFIYSKLQNKGEIVKMKTHTKRKQGINRREMVLKVFNETSQHKLTVDDVYSCLKDYFSRSLVVYHIGILVKGGVLKREREFNNMYGRCVYSLLENTIVKKEVERAEEKMENDITKILLNAVADTPQELDLLFKILIKNGIIDNQGDLTKEALESGNYFYEYSDMKRSFGKASYSRYIVVNSQGFKESMKLLMRGNEEDI